MRRRWVINTVTASAFALGMLLELHFAAAMEKDGDQTPSVSSLRHQISKIASQKISDIESEIAVQETRKNKWE